MVEPSALKKSFLICVIINSANKNVKAAVIKHLGDIKSQAMLYLVDLAGVEGLIMLHTSVHAYQVDS